MSVRLTSERRRVAESVIPSVLIVDDREANLLALEAILEPLKLHVVRATSGEEALKRLLKHEFALILLDVQMPVMDGFETASAIKLHPRMADIPIIFVTAISREVNHIFEGYQRGAVDYILKPFDPYILKAKVAVFVELFLKSATIKEQGKQLRKRELEAAFRQSEERYRRLMDLMPLVIWAVRPDGSVSFVNGAFTDYSGLDAKGVQRIDDPRLIHPEDAPSVQSRWATRGEAGSFFEMQYRLRRNDGQYRWHLVRGVAEQTEQGGVEGWIVAATDIDDQKHIEHAREQLIQQEQLARKSAETANRMKDEFLANVSHELRTPLNAILGWTKMLRSGMVAKDRRTRTLETIERNAQLQVKLVEDLLDVSRIVSGTLRLQLRTVDVVALTRATFESMKPAAEAKGVTLELTSSSPEEKIAGDPDRLQQIVNNLVVNAVKFTPAEGRVEVRIEGGDAVDVTVRDTGIGISPEFLPHVFDRFRQEKNASEQSSLGLGLGLAIVQKLVELHGGRVHAESAGPGLGSTFKIRLPRGMLLAEPSESVWFDEEEKSSKAHSLVGEPQLAGLTILFVDDHLEARELFAELMESFGAKVVAVATAAEAMKALANGDLDVLVSDIGLPDQDGFSLIRDVRALGPDGPGRIPAIAVSGLAGIEHRGRALNEGFQICLSKPINAAELVGLVANLADRGPAGVPS